MTFNKGTQLGTYEILGPLGTGGMGEVYRARDSRLKREVAIKVLPDTFSRDADRIARFQREAEALAALNHPHIAAIYDLVDSGSSRFLVLELVDGETLAERIGRGPIPMEESLSIARQIAEAVEGAHEKGIIHRDLKPANIKVTGDGNVKVLDFGLAKIREVEAADLSNSPTMMSASAPGVILGTAAYMAPEQAKGKQADRTSDVWSFGCVLYEMLTGGRVFEGETVSEILAGVLKTEPDWNRLPAETPEGIRRLLRRCLQKDRKLRLHDIADARIEIDEAGSESGKDDIVVVQGPMFRRKERLAWIAALALVTLMAAILGVRAFRPAPGAPEVRLEITTPPTADPASIAISPDGRTIVFAAIDEGQSQLWLRSLNSTSARRLEGTGGAIRPFWSPDGRSLGFFAEGKLKRIDIDRGSVQSLVDAGVSPTGAWNGNNVILFNQSPAGPLFRIAATGGEIIAVTQAEPSQIGHGNPQFLPDGNHFLYFAGGSPEVAGVYIGELDRLEGRRLLDADSGPVFVSSGQLLFVRQGTLFAQDFDPIRLEMSGNPFPVADGFPPPDSFAPLFASAAGTIIFRTGNSSSGVTRLVWLDRSGKEVETVGDQDGGTSPSLSPDGQRLAIHRAVNGNVDIWLVELERAVFTRFTSDAANEIFPLWSPDGDQVVFSRLSTVMADLYLKYTTGTETEELLLSAPRGTARSDWSPDGRYLLYRSTDPKTKTDLWALPLAGDRKPFPVVQTDFEERDAQFSPDGKWIAYQTDESGRFEIYVQPFPGPGTKYQVSTTGGVQVRWRRDGKELFYVALNGQLTAVPIQFDPNGEAVKVGAPTALFATRFKQPNDSNDGQQYVVSADGQRFLMAAVPNEAASPITVILNWKPENRGQ